MSNRNGGRIGLGLAGLFVVQPSGCAVMPRLYLLLVLVLLGGTSAGILFARTVAAASLSVSSQAAGSTRLSEPRAPITADTIDHLTEIARLPRIHTQDSMIRLRFSPDGSRLLAAYPLLASAASGPYRAVWFDLTTGAEAGRFGYPASVGTPLPVFSVDNRALVLFEREIVYHAANDRLTLLDATGGRVFRLRLAQPALAPADAALCHLVLPVGLTVNDSGRILAHGACSHILVVWDARTGRLVTQPLPYGERIAVSDGTAGRMTRPTMPDEPLYIYPLTERRAALTLTSDPPRSGMISVSPDWTTLAFTPDHLTAQVRVWRDGDFTADITLSGTISGLALNPAGDLVMVRQLRPDGGFSTHLYRADGGERVHSIPDTLQPVVFSPDGTLLLTTDRRGALWLWGVPSSPSS